MIARPVCAFLILLRLLTCAARSATIVPTAADHAAFAKGQMMQRQIDVFQNPGICGIVLERERCRADFDPPGPIASFIASGDLSDYDQKWGDANSTMVPSQEWKSDPRSAWLQTAGIASILGRWPRNPVTDLFSVLPLDSLVQHAAESGPYAMLVPDFYVRAARSSGAGKSALTPEQGAQFEKSLLPKLDAIFGTTAFPSPVLPATALSDVRFGIYGSTLQELLDSPIGFSEPASRAFAKAIVQQYASLAAPTEKAIAVRIISELDGPLTDPAVNGKQLATMRSELQDILDAMLQSWPQNRKEAYVLGMLTAQAAYNAAVLKDKTSDARFRAVVASLPLPAGAPDSVKADFQALASANPGDWRTVNAAATRATLDLMRLTQ